MKYARIENDTVMEIIDFDPAGKFTPEIVAQFVECEETTKQRDEYKGGKFNKPTPKQKTAKEIKEEKEAQIKGLADASDVEALYTALKGLGVISDSDVPTKTLERFNAIAALKKGLD